jgi:uracil phosphoribosyltransferase
MPINIINHPVFSEALHGLRDRQTKSSEFRTLAARAGVILAVEATKHLPTEETSVETPLTTSVAKRIKNRVVIVPVLRAGLSLVEAFHTVIPGADVGHIGLRRDENTAKAERYSCSLPLLIGADIFVLDPMLATGGSACGALELLDTKGANSIHYVSIIAAPEGVKVVQAKFPLVSITVGVVDERLNEQFFIVPGLGDFGDRLFGT